MLNLINHNEKVFNHSLLSFFRAGKEQIISFEKNNIENSIQSGKLKIFNSHKIDILYEHLEWDTKFFGRNTIKIKCILYEDSVIILLKKIMTEFLKNYLEKGTHVLIEVPSKEITDIHTLTGLGFYLIETRINYYKDTNKHRWERNNTRLATENDIPNLRKIATEMRNPFDRFHSDPFYTTELADRFLSKYVEESIKGLADIVIVPDEKHIPPDSLITASYMNQSWVSSGLKASKIILTAVSNLTNIGWFLKLNSEMIYRLKEKGADYVYFQTASTNNAVIHTNEKLGYKIGNISHYFSYMT